jgi:purine-binding chemotaxis protein CheW
MSETRQYCTFYVDRMLLGVEVLQVQEVIRRHEITEVPLAPPALSGLMNLRGTIISCIDLRRRFGLPRASSDMASTNIVVQNGAGLASLQVDRICDVIEVAGHCFEAPPETLREEVRHLIDQVCKLEGALLLTLNLGRVLEIETVLSTDCAENFALGDYGAAGSSLGCGLPPRKAAELIKQEI